MAGKFVTFEGGEGSGKSTQIAALAEVLRARGETVVCTREPGGTPAAEDIRDILVSGSVDRWSPVAEMLLNFAARAMHVRDLIGPALARGDWVLCDRFADSTMAYQGYAGGVPLEDIRAVYRATLGDFGPDLTLVFDLPVDVGLRRAGKRIADTTSIEDRFERMGAEFHDRLRQGFLSIAAADPVRCRVIDADNDIAAVTSSMTAAVAAVYDMDLS